MQLLFQGSAEDLKKTWVQQPALFALECAIAKQLMTWGVYPLAVAGHSVGEMAALWAADVYSFEDGFRLVNERARCMKTASRLHKDTGMMAVHAGLNSVEAAVSRKKGVSIANINAPNQVVLSGPMVSAVSHGAGTQKTGASIYIVERGNGLSLPHDEVGPGGLCRLHQGPFPLHAPAGFR